MKFNDVSVLLLQTLVITGDPQKGPGGALAPLAFENMQIYLKIGKGSVIAGPPKVRPGSPMFVTLHSHSHLPPIFCHLSQSRPTTACDASDIRWQGFLGRFVKTMLLQEQEGWSMAY